MTDTGGKKSAGDEQELIRVERFTALATRHEEMLNDARGYTTLEAWQLRDVVDGKVCPEAMVVYHTVQSFGRSLKPCWPGNARLASILKLTPRSVQRSLAQLEDAGWIVRERVQRQVDRQFYRVITCQRSRAGTTSHVAQTGGVASSGVVEGGDARRHTNNHHDELPGEGAAQTPDVVAPEAVVRDAADAAPPDPALEDMGKRNDTTPAWAQDLAEELMELYPHGIRDNGRWRKPSRTEVARKLVVIFKGKRAGSEEHEALAQEIRRGAQAERAVAPPPEDPERRFVKGLEVWLNQRCWTDPPTFACTVPGATVRPNSNAQGSEHAKLEREAEHMQRLIEEQGPQPRFVERLNLFLRKLGRPEKFLQVTQGAPDAAGTPATPGASGPAGAQPRARNAATDAPLADAVGRVVGAVRKRQGSGRLPAGGGT